MTFYMSKQMEVRFKYYHQKWNQLSAISNFFPQLFKHHNNRRSLLRSYNNLVDDRNVSQHFS